MKVAVVDEPVASFTSGAEVATDRRGSPSLS